VKSLAIKTGLWFTKYRTGETGNQSNSPIRLPVNPTEYSVTKATDNTRYNVLDLGEIIVPRTPKLITFSWDGLLPGTDEEQFVVTKGNDFRPPQFYIDYFTLAQKERQPLSLSINRFNDNGTPIYDSTLWIIVEDFAFTEKGGETGDFYYSISLTEYRNYNPEAVTILEQPQSNMPVSIGEETPAVAVVTPQREVSPVVICVGDTVVANGDYRYSSWGAKPFGTANNLTTTVTRIVQNPVSGQDYPVHIGQYGWLKMEQLQKVV
jgi:hypothetical protein